MEKELWKDVLGYKGRYMVSSHGRVMSFVASGNPRRKVNPVTPKVLRPGNNTRGYPCVSLRDDDGNAKGHTVHKLVLQSFVSERPEKKEANHIDGVKENNNMSNLEWITHSRNCLHAFRSGLKESKWDDAAIYALKDMFIDGRKEEDLAVVFDMSLTYARRIILGRTRKSVVVGNTTGALRGFLPRGQSPC